MNNVLLKCNNVIIPRLLNHFLRPCRLPMLLDIKTTFILYYRHLIMAHEQLFPNVPFLTILVGLTT